MTSGTTSLADELAAKLAEALHRHVPDFRGMFYEQLLAVAQDLIVEHSGSPEPRAPQLNFDD